MDYQIIDNQAEFLVINKSPGVDFHSSEQGLGLFRRLCMDLALEKAFPVHRLDKTTSGLVLVAKSLSAARKLNHLFYHREVGKFYLALSKGKPKKKQGLVAGDMHRSRRSSWKLSKSMTDPALTQFFSRGLGGGFRLFLLKPLTGKTHQLRVALKSLGTPVLGDPIYAPSNAKLCSNYFPPGKTLDRSYLHAYSLCFSYDTSEYRYCCHPDQGELFHLPEVRDSIQAFSKPWELSWPKVKFQKQ